MQLSRRQFFKVAAGGLTGSSLVAMGFSPTAALAEVRTFKLARSTETRNTCPYCSVGCGIIMYSLGDKAKNVTADIVHIEGDPDHPVNRGTLCPKGAGLLDFVHSANRLKFPEIREPGAKEWKRVSWDDAMSRLTKFMKADRDGSTTTTVVPLDDERRREEIARMLSGAVITDEARAAASVLIG